MIYFIFIFLYAVKALKVKERDSPIGQRTVDRSIYAKHPTDSSQTKKGILIYKNIQPHPKTFTAELFPDDFIKVLFLYI